MSPETFLLLCAIYLAIVVIAVVLRIFFDKSPVYREDIRDNDSRRVTDDVNRMRTLADIEYYKNLQNTYRPKDRGDQ
jgi:hypothetical protein